MNYRYINLHPSLNNIKPEDIVTTYIAHTFTKPSVKGNDEILILKEIILTKDGNTYPRFKIIINPTTTYYLVKPQYRTYQFKKERELITRLDKYKCENREIVEHIKRNLKIFDRRTGWQAIMSHPYVYGADIDIASRFKMTYYEKNQKQPPYSVKCAYVDIEKDVLTKEINVMSLSYNKKCYVFINKKYMIKHNENDDSVIHLTLEDIQKVTYELIGNILKEYGYELEWFVYNNERDLLINFFKLIHSMTDIDFIGIWNLDYDVPEIEQSLINNGIQPIDLFNSPLLDSEFKYYKYIRDGVTRDHYILKWHWLMSPASFQWIDAMTLYAWNRRTQPYEDKYSLDFIMNKYLDFGKLFVIDDHAKFQKYRFDEYCAYNCIDSIGFNILMDMTRDLQRMYDLSSMFDIKDYGFSTIRLRNKYYYFYKKRGYIIASNGKKINLPYEDEIPNAGGAVLPSQNGVFLNTKLIKEDDMMETMINLNCADFDYTSLYPSLMVALRIARETMAYGTLKIENKPQKDVYDFFSKLILIDENIVNMCNKYFGLPTYKKLYNKFKQFIEE